MPIISRGLILLYKNFFVENTKLEDEVSRYYQGGWGGGGGERVGFLISGILYFMVGKKVAQLTIR